jgi:aldehyde dehydrogenase (NAD+)
VTTTSTETDGAPGLTGILLGMLGPVPKGADRLRDATAEHQPAMLVGGELVRSPQGATLPNVDPVTGQVTGYVDDGGPAELDRAIAAARTAFDDGPWRHDPELRARCLRQLQEAMRSHREELRIAVIRELGSPVRLTASVHVDQVIEKLGFLADAATANGDVDLPDEVIGESRSVRRIVREPVGVVGAITPWNIPLDIPMAKVGGALAAGCTVVLKPAPDTPLSLNLVARLAAEHTDLPPGVLNIVASSDHTLGKRLVDDPRVDLVSFTGSTATGRRVMAGAAETLKRVHLELGGKSPNIVLDDVDLEAVVPLAAAAGCFNAGQSCILPSRLLVPAARYDECVELARVGMAAVPVGDPLDEGTFMGPLVTAQHRDRVHELVQQGLAAGGRLVLGGEMPEGPGFFYPPTLVADVAENHPLVQQEIFGPVVVVQPYTDDEDAVRVANGTDFGLAGYVWAVDRDRAERLASRVQAGMIAINGGGITGADMPFGGVKHSGFGREWGAAGVEEFTELKTVSRGGALG